MPSASLAELALPGLEALCHRPAARLHSIAAADGIERLQAHFVGCGFAPHRHDTYAIGITLFGVQSFRFRGQRWQCLPGQCHILHPDELHDGAAATAEGFGYRILYIDPALVRQASGGVLPFAADPVLDAARLPPGFAAAVWGLDARLPAAWPGEVPARAEWLPIPATAAQARGADGHGPTQPAAPHIASLPSPIGHAVAARRGASPPTNAPGATSRQAARSLPAWETAAETQDTSLARPDRCDAPTEAAPPWRPGQRAAAGPDDVAQAEVAVQVAALLALVTGGPPPHGTLALPRLGRVRDLIAAEPALRHSMAALERVAGLDRWTLARQFRAAYGTSPSRFRTLRQLDRVRSLLRRGIPLAEAAAASGFADQAHMTRQFKRAYGLTPGAWVGALA